MRRLGSSPRPRARWSLGFYCAFAVLLFALMRRANGRGGPWPAIGLVGGIGGPLVAAVALGARAILVAAAGSAANDRVNSLFELAQRARMASALLALLFLLGYGVAALRSGELPAPLA